MMRTVDDDNLIKICKKNEEDGEIVEKMVALNQGCISHETLQVRSVKPVTKRHHEVSGSLALLQ